MFERPSEKIIYVAISKEDLATAFSKEVNENCYCRLTHWRATAIDDPAEFEQWEQKRKSLPELAEKNSLERILKIMNDPNSYKKYYKKIRKGCFKRTTMISITDRSGFYEDLVKGECIGQPINVEYLLDLSTFTMIKRVYSQNISL